MNFFVPKFIEDNSHHLWGYLMSGLNMSRIIFATINHRRMAGIGGICGVYSGSLIRLLFPFKEGEEYSWSSQ